MKYAERDARRAEHFLGGDPHDAPMPMDYFVWAVVGADGTWVVDTGFGEPDAERRHRRLAAVGRRRAGHRSASTPRP